MTSSTSCSTLLEKLKAKFSETLASEVEEALNIKLSCSNILKSYTPYPRFASISITGSRCELLCKHCQGHYLSQMIPAETPEKFLAVIEKLAKKDVKGILVSGGFDRSGKLPFRRFVSVIKKAKLLGFTVAIHAGLLSDKDVEELCQAEVDATLVDVVGDDQTISEILGLKARAEDFFNTVVKLKEAGLFVAPHIVIGLNHGILRGEFKALQFLSNVGTEALSLLVYVPTPNTPSALDAPPKLEDIVRVAAQARRILRTAHLTLGCMRPRGWYRTLIEQAMVLCGVDGIVNPSFNTIALAKDIGLRVRKVEGCCVFKSL